MFERVRRRAKAPADAFDEEREWLLEDAPGA
jgi:hypothetical protein